MQRFDCLFIHPASPPRSGAGVVLSPLSCQLLLYLHAQSTPKLAHPPSKSSPGTPSEIRHILSQPTSACARRGSLVCGIVIAIEQSEVSAFRHRHRIVHRQPTQHTWRSLLL